MQKLQLGEFKSVDDLHIFSGSFIRHQDLFFSNDLSCYLPIILSKAERLKIHYASIATIQKYLPTIANDLNEKNQFNYSLRYWHSFLSFWLSSLVPNLIEKYFRIEKFIKEAKKPYEVELLFSNGPIFFKDDYNYNENMFQGIEFNHYLLSLILKSQEEFLKNKGWIFTSQKKVFNFDTPAPSPLFTAPSGNIELVTGLGKFEVAILNILSKIRIKGRQFYDYSCLDTNNQSIPPLDWENILKELCPHSYFSLGPEIIKNTTSLNRNFYIFSGTHLPLSKRLMVSSAREKGIPIYISQHGSSYGEPLCSTLPLICQYTLGGFISWGWMKQDHHPAKIIPMPSPALTKIKIRRFFNGKSKSKKIVFISSVYTPNASGSVSLDADQTKKTFHILSDFLENLSPEVWQSFYFRPRPTHLNSRFNFFPILQKKFKSIKELSGLFDKVIADADLVIQFQDGSTLNKVMAAKIPTIILGSKDHFPLNDELEASLSLVENKNIYFTDPIKAADYINKIYPDLRSKLKDNPKHWDFYRQQYCQTSYFYFFKWLKLLFKI